MRLFLHIFMFSALFLGISANASIGKVSLVKGEGTLVRDGASSALQTGISLEQKDGVTTKTDSSAQLLFDDKTVITLGSNSDFSVQEYLNSSSNSKLKFKVNQGSFKSITGAIGKNAPKNFAIETKTATIGIRGTWIEGRIDPDGDWIACFRGEIAVRALKGGKVVNVEEGYKVFIGFDGKITPPMPISVDGFVGFEVSKKDTEENSKKGDYGSWGYWASRDFRGIDNYIEELPLDKVQANTSVGPNDPTPEAIINNLISTNASFGYTNVTSASGTITISGSTPNTITDATTNLAFDFGASRALLTTFNLSYSSGGVSLFTSLIPTGSSSDTALALAPSFGGFSASWSEPTNGTLTISGNLLGPNAESISGAFNKTGGNITANGTFTAARP